MNTLAVSTKRISPKAIINTIGGGVMMILVLFLIGLTYVYSQRESRLVQEAVSIHNCTIDDYYDLSSIGGEGHKELALKISGHVPLQANMVVICAEGNRFVFLDRELVKQDKTYQNSYTVKGNLYSSSE